jgi:hypothetical protein
MKGRAVSCFAEAVKAYLYGLPALSVEFVAGACEMRVQHTFGSELVRVGSCINDAHHEAEDCCHEHNRYPSTEAFNKPPVMNR